MLKKILACFGVSLLTLVSLVFASGNSYGYEVGSVINTDVDTSAPATTISISSTTLEPDQVLVQGSTYKLSSESDSRILNLTCSGNIQTVNCSVSTAALVAFLNPLAGWQTADATDLYVLASINGQEQQRWPAQFLKIDALVPKAIQVTDSSNGNYLTGSTNNVITLTTRTLNRTNLDLANTTVLVLNGEVVDQKSSDGGVSSFTIDGESLEDGSNSLKFVGTNEYGEVSKEFNIEKYLPRVDEISTSLPVVFYPIRDGFEDTAEIVIDVLTPTSQIIPGSGTVSVTNSAKVVLATWKLTSSGQATFQFSGLYKNKPVTGILTLAVSFTARNGNTLSNKQTFTASSKKLVDVTTSATVLPWRAISSCSPFSYSCNHWNGLTDTSGVELYNESFNRNHRSTFTAVAPLNAYKWKATLNGFKSGLRSAPYLVRASNDNNQIIAGDLAKTTTRLNWKGIVSTLWSNLPSGENAHLTFTSTNWGSIYFKSITFTFVSRVLK